MKKTKASKPKKTTSKKDASKTKKDVSIKAASSKKPGVVAAGHLVSVDYTGTLDNGDEFDSSKNNGPISFVVGSGHVIKGFDDAVVGMKLNDSKKFKIKKEHAYGDVNPQLMHKIPMDKLPEDMRKQVKEGGFLVMQSPIGQQIPAKVHSIKNNEITLDLNHPLAGKDLTFDIKVKDISVPSEKDLHDAHHGHDHGHDHSKGECECGGDCECDEESDDCCGGSCNCK